MPEFSRLPLKDAMDLLKSLRTVRDAPDGKWRFSHPSVRIARVLHRHGIEVCIDEDDGTMVFMSEWHPGHRPVHERLTR